MLFGLALAAALPITSAEAAGRPAKPKGLHVVRTTHASLSVAWRPPRARGTRRYSLYMRGQRFSMTRAPRAMFSDLACGSDYVIQVDAVLANGVRSARSSVSARTAACDIVDLSTQCKAGNCDDAFDALKPGVEYHLPAGTWKVTRPITIPSNVTLTGDGVGLNGTDIVYAGPPIDGAVMTAGAPGSDWVNGHIGGLEVETDQLHRLRVVGDMSAALVRIGQAGVGLRIVNPTSTSTVTNVNFWKFGANSVLIDNHAAKPGAGVFQFSNFFIGTSPRPLEINGSRARLLVRYGGIDLGPVSEMAMKVNGDDTGPTSVVESVKIEGDYDVPGYIVNGSAPVVFVGTTRYYNQSLYVDKPNNGAPAYVNRDTSSTALQCLACTALGVETALSMPAVDRDVPTSKWGIDLHRLTASGRKAVAGALATPETPVPRPRDVIELAPLCVDGNCDAALATMKQGLRYHLAAGVWQFSQPFTIPTQATLFGDGPQSVKQGGTVLRYVGGSLPGDAAVRFGQGGWSTEAIRLFSLTIDTQKSLTGGFGVRARDATNASTIEDIAVSGFPDGQIQLDATPDGGGSGPNFVRVARFRLTGGVHPLEIDEGRQTVLIERGDIHVGSTSQEGVNLQGGEQLAATRVIASVVVDGSKDVPGFRVRGPAVTAFVGSARITDGARLGSPGFLYTATVPRAATECLDCSTMGAKTGFSMPQLDVDASDGDGESIDHLNSDSSLTVAPKPFNTALPTIVGSASAGGTLTAQNGSWMNAPTGYAYQWIRCKPPAVASNPANRCVQVAGATGQSYAVTSADSGSYLRVSVAATNGDGTRAATSLAVLAG